MSPLPYPFWHLHCKLETCLEEVGCTGTILAGIIIILLLYADDFVLMARCYPDLDKQLRILKYFFSNMGMTVNTDKTKIMIIKSKKDTFANFIYDSRNLEEVTYKYLGIDIHHKLNWNYSTEKRINGGWKPILVLKIIVNESSLLSCMVVKFVSATFLENLG